MVGAPVLHARAYRTASKDGKNCCAHPAINSLPRPDTLQIPYASYA